MTSPAAIRKRRERERKKAGLELVTFLIPAKLVKRVTEAVRRVIG